MTSPFRDVLVIGGAGYVGAALVPKLLAAGHRVRVFDLFLYGEHVFDGERGRPGLELVRGDVRDQAALGRALSGCQAVIHLACISNDPSFELDPELGKAINFTAFEPCVRMARAAGVRRFVYASTSSVYGISEAPDVAEDHPLRPLTDYSRYKAECERVLLGYRAPGFVPVVIRPATVCGWSPRLRLDLVVNILTSHAVQKGGITVFGGESKRPNIHIADISDLYVELLRVPDALIDGETFNAGYQNHTVMEIAGIVRDVVERELPGRGKVRIEVAPTDDKRSYHISSRKIAERLGFVPRRTIEDAVSGLVAAFRDGRIADPSDLRYHNIKTMQAARLR